MFCMILSGFPLIFCSFISISDGKSCFSVKKCISTSKRRAEHRSLVKIHNKKAYYDQRAKSAQHPNAGRNIQPSWVLATLDLIFFYLTFNCHQSILFLSLSLSLSLALLLGQIPLSVQAVYNDSKVARSHSSIIWIITKPGDQHRRSQTAEEALS